MKEPIKRCCLGESRQRRVHGMAADCIAAVLSAPGSGQFERPLPATGQAPSPVYNEQIEWTNVCKQKDTAASRRVIS